MIVRETAFQLAADEHKPSIQDIYRALANDEARNSMIEHDVIQAIEEGRSPIV